MFELSIQGRDKTFGNTRSDAWTCSAHPINPICSTRDH